MFSSLPAMENFLFTRPRGEFLIPRPPPNPPWCSREMIYYLHIRSTFFCPSTQVFVMTPSCSCASKFCAKQFWFYTGESLKSRSQYTLIVGWSFGLIDHTHSVISRFLCLTRQYHFVIMTRNVSIQTNYRKVSRATKSCVGV